MAISVLGLGYVGLTLAVTLAKVGYKVYGVEVDRNKVERLKRGEPTIYEPQLEDMVKDVLKNGAFHVNESLTKEIVSTIETYIVCVGTPIDEITKKPIFVYLENSINELTNYLKRGDLVVIRSTVPVGITRNFIKKLLEEKTGFHVGKDFYLVFAPERTVQGAALRELRELPQIIGGIDESSIEKAVVIFSKITNTIIRMSSFEAAEIVKLLDNTSRDVHIALANMFGLICTNLGLDSREIVRAANYGYPRNRIYIPGAGVGGACLVKDPYFLMASLNNDKLELPLIKLARQINDSMPEHMIRLLEDAFKEMGKEVNGSNILILGFAFKGDPPTDDLRYSPTLPVLDYLKKQGARIFGYDSIVKPDKIMQLGAKPVELDKDMVDVDCIVIMNNNKAYQKIDYKKIITNANKSIALVDGWQLIDPVYIKSLGYCYRCVGTGNSKIHADR